MFNNLDPKNKDIDDIFADTDNASAAPVAPPASGPMPAAIKTPMASATPIDADLNLEEPSTKFKMGRVLKKIFIFIIVLALIGVAAYFIYAKLLINNAGDPQNTDIPVVETPVSPVVTTIPATTTITLTTTTVVALDSDSDGLTDAEEAVLTADPNKADTDADGLIDGDEVKIYLTSPILPDTDADGLIDGEEVNIYKTDPNKADTDGDGYLDGAEVKAGYDPLTKPVK
ncbi:hypothetical protein COX21_01820 [Candidatus Falkowbacteria bacterium CG23_combo_of_CG06-09_8_20_14_all_41_10]|uniref:EF-hand domain-containing protein n=1 Tax=Candidatus Falkowbacteria bacterium CG23_combo_of_CG06-09_8_20_14_all_41_10 TaxID=1974571 RepID=A0A2G9ZNG2_9BACT|nr:MAG: hypothetical protein COX21_01820 [Candidatus Falkowbacteria bacterium CG23_combo_of_CG06-09_8_20_14_all_41_10]